MPKGIGYGGGGMGGGGMGDGGMGGSGRRRSDARGAPATMQNSTQPRGKKMNSNGAFGIYSGKGFNVDGVPFDAGTKSAAKNTDKNYNEVMSSAKKFC